MKGVVSSLLVGLLVRLPPSARLPTVHRSALRGPLVTLEYTVAKRGPPKRELLARLVYAEALSTGIGEPTPSSTRPSPGAS